MKKKYKEIEINLHKTFDDIYFTISNNTESKKEVWITIDQISVKIEFKKLRKALDLLQKKLQCL